MTKTPKHFLSKIKKYIFILFDLLFCFSSFAQVYLGEKDWQCIDPTKKVYFEDNNKLVYCIRIDSTFNDNTILYPFSDLHQIDWDCYSATSGSWLSKYILINEDGNTIFVNGKNQQILIKNKAELNEIWDVFTNDNIKVTGKISSISTESILGVEDLVKTISFLVYNNEGEPINHILNQHIIKISKHFGLVKTVNFYYFEHITDYYYHFGEFNLIGITEPQLGFKNINLREQYYDFQVGDELHIWDLTDIFLSYMCEKKSIHRYLSRNEYADSIVYYCERRIYSETKQFIDGSLNVETSTTIDTIKQKIIKGYIFHTEPNEIYDDINKVMIVNNPLLTMYLFSYDLQKTEDTCLTSIFVDACNVYPTYYLGLGGPYYRYCEIFNNRYASELVYYKKGNTEWGNPFNLSISESKKSNFYNIYPNPADNYITIKSTNNENVENYILEIYDIYGRRCLSQRFNSSEFIDVSFLKTGYYFIKLIQQNGNIMHLKFVKQ